MTLADSCKLLELQVDNILAFSYVQQYVQVELKCSAEDRVHCVNYL